jgi:alkyl sulfatase BDS1-like metallo-beta-lactamase superfamily hydrolase
MEQLIGNLVSIDFLKGNIYFFRSIRAIFDRYLGWFSGKTSDLNVDSPKIRAENLIKLGGGSEKVFENAEKAFKEEKYQWVLELTEALNLYPENFNISKINQLQCLTLQKLASREISANGRNWYLTKSLEIQNLIQIKPSELQIIETISKASLKNCFILLSVNFNYQKAEGKNNLILFHFIDTNDKFSVHIRNGIVDVDFHWPENISSTNIEIIVEVKTELIWKEIIARLKSPMQVIEDEQIIIKDGNQQFYPEGVLQFIEFLLMFAP